tara:strand:+ start:125 stop:508 length:384 start_codon:yes stop_codon:yes gene_type:complete
MNIKDVHKFNPVRIKYIKDLQKIISIQASLIETQNHTLSIKDKSYEKEVSTFEKLLERNYRGHGTMMNDLLYFRGMAEHWYKQYIFILTGKTLEEVTADRLKHQPKKGKKKNVEEKDKKNKRGVKSK